MARKLTKKQELFIKYYLIKLDATYAAKKAGYSKKTASVIGCENLTKPKIAERIDAEMKKRSERILLSGDDVLKEIEDLMRRNLLEDDKLALEAMKLLGKHMALFKDIVKHEGEMNNTITFDNVSSEDIKKMIDDD